MDQKSTWLIKICCVIAAFSLWLYIANLESNQIPQRISVPVTLTGLENVTEQKLKILPPMQPYTVTLNVTGSLTDVQLNKEQFKAVADFSEWVFTKGERTIPVRIERQPANVTIVNTGTLSIKVAFDDLKEKNMPIKISQDGKIKDGFFALEPSLTPSDAHISGAAKFVDQVDHVEVKIDLKNADKDLNLKLPVKAVDASGKEVKNVDVSPDSVEISIPIRKTKTVGINVKTKGTINKDYILKSLTPTPDKVDIAGGENVNGINTLDTEPIDLSTLTPNKVVVVKIIKPEGINFTNSDGTVKVKATLDKIIQKTFSLDIQIKKANDNFNITLDNPKLSLVVTGPESQINALKNEDFNCNIDIGAINNEGDHSVRVNYTLPEGISKVSANPENVKVTLKKKGEQTPPGTNTPTT